LVDDLLARRYRNLTVMDLSSTALEVARARLGADANKITWLCGDGRTFAFGPHRYDVWHHRAMFHFLTRASDRVAYVRQARHAVKPGGHVIIATFGPEGPTKCSGLDVLRYDADALHDEFGTAVRLVTHRTELHQTPMGSTQQLTYCYCRISAS
jgi:SAM-dependent methyltransferase